MPVSLSAQDIYDKEFAVEPRGYSASEVDAYLDQIIEDYQEYEEQTQKLSSALVSCDQKIKELSEENASLKAAAASLQEQLQTMSAQLEEAQKQAALAKTSSNEAAASVDTPAVVVEQAAVEEISTPQFKVEAKEATLEERVVRLEKAVFGK